MQIFSSKTIKHSFVNTGETLQFHSSGEFYCSAFNKKYVVLTHLQVFGNFSVLVLLEIWNLNHQITFKLPFSFPARSQPCCGSSCSFFFFLSFFLTFIFLLFLIILLTFLLLCFFDLFIWGKDDKVLQELLVKYIKGLSDGAIESLKHSSTANNLISYHRVSFTLTPF